MGELTTQRLDKHKNHTSNQEHLQYRRIRKVGLLPYLEPAVHLHLRPECFIPSESQDHKNKHGHLGSTRNNYHKAELPQRYSALIRRRFVEGVNDDYTGGQDNEAGRDPELRQFPAPICGQDRGVRCHRCICVLDSPASDVVQGLKESPINTRRVQAVEASSGHNRQTRRIVWPRSAIITRVEEQPR